MPFSRPAVSDAAASSRPARCLRDAFSSTTTHRGSIVEICGRQTSSSQKSPSQLLRATRSFSIVTFHLSRNSSYYVNTFTDRKSYQQYSTEKIHPTLRNEIPEKRAIIGDASTVHANEAVNGNWVGIRTCRAPSIQWRRQRSDLR